MADSLASARLVALVRAGPYRLALPAEAVREVVRAGDGESLLRALGEPETVAGEWAVALQAKSLRRFRVDAVEGVRPRGDSPSLNLPAGVGVDVPELFRGAFQMDGALALELRPEALDDLPPRAMGSPPALHGTSEPAPRALLFTAAGRSIGFALPQVLSVVARPAVCPVPRAGLGVRGVVEHGQTLYPVLDLGARHFGRPSPGELGVLVDQDGRALLVLADAILGVRQGFRAVDGDEPGWLQGERGERALFPLLEG